MANQLLFADFANYDDWMRSITALIAANTEFGDNAVETNERIKKSLHELIGTLALYQRQMQAAKGGGQVLGMKDDVLEITTAYRNQNKVLQQNQQLFESNNKVISQMQARLEALQKEYAALDLTQKADIKRKKEIERETVQTTKALNSLTEATNKASKAVRVTEGSYNALNKQTKELKDRLRDIPDAFDKVTGRINKHNQAAVEMQARIQANEKVLKMADAQMGNYQRNVGNYGSAISGFGKNILSYAGQIIGISTAFEAVSKAIQITADMERLDAGLKAVSRDTDDFNRSQQFLMNTADELGVRYDSLVKSYKLLKAATKDTSLEGAETEHIFHAVAEAGARLGLTAEDTEGALNALQQMISKGKVTAEELRQQLGDRLPAAFRIMAAATGVSEIELDKMMSKGELLAVDVLPKFATELDKIYGGNAQEKIMTMSAGWNRMTNAAEQFIAAFNENKKVSTFFGTVQTGIADVLKDLTTLIKSDEWGVFFNYLTGGARVGNAIAGSIRAANDMAAQNEKNFRGLSAEERQKQVNAADEKRLKIERELNALIKQSPTEAVREKELALQKELNKAQARYNFLVKTNNDQVAQDSRIEVARAKEKAAVAKSQKEKEDKERTAAQRKAEAELNRKLSSELGVSKSGTDNNLASLNDSRQDGLINEQQYIEQRLQITLDGLNARQAILEKYGKKETDDYINIQKEKQKADTDYKRAQLKLDLDANKGKTATNLADVDFQRSTGELDEATYLERRRAVLLRGIEQERQILKDAGQEQSQAYKDLDADALKVEREYYRDRLKVVKDGWQKELQAAREGLNQIDQQTAAGYETQLAKINDYYNKQRGSVQLDVASGKISDSEGDKQLHVIDMNQLDSEMKAYENAIMEDRRLSDGLINDKMEGLRNLRDYSNATEKDVLEYNKQIAELEKQLEKDKADDKAKLDKKTADNAIAQSDKELQHKIQNAEKEKQIRQQMTDVYMQVGETLANGLFTIEQQNTANQMAELQRRQEYEMSTYGNNEAAKNALQKKFDNERKQLQRKQDKDNQNQSLFNIAMNTAQAVMKTYSQFGFPAGIPLALAQTALGAVQAGIVLSTPLPTYFKGKNFEGITSDTYAGPAIAGERGREIWVHDGQAELLDKPSLINVGRDDTIFPNHITEQLLERNSILSRTNRQTSANKTIEANLEIAKLRSGPMRLDSSSIHAIVTGLGSKLENLPFNYSVFDEDGVTDYTQTKNMRVINRNKKHTF